MDSGEVGAIAAVLSALFAAFAAAASWRSAGTARRAVELAHEPHLTCQVVRHPDDGSLLLSIDNDGGGVAHGASFAVAACGKATDGVLDDGVLKAGERVIVSTTIGPLPKPEGMLRADRDDLGAMVAYRDREGFVHYRTNDGRSEDPTTGWRRKRAAFRDRLDVFRAFWPNVGIDTATRAGHHFDRV